MATEGLTELEDEAWRGFLMSHERIWRQIEADLAPFGVSSTEYSVLALLGEAGRRGIRLSELAEQRMMSTAGLSRLADRLEQRGLVERCRVETDGRGYGLTLTPAGRPLVGQAWEPPRAGIACLLLDEQSDVQPR